MFFIQSPTLTVTAINDNDANVGTQITLASGALLTLNSDGTFEYDQNGAFDDLEQGQTDTDSFTYTITDGQEVSPSDSAPSPPPGFGIADPRVFNEDSTTVNITINGTAPQLPVAEDDSANTDEKNQVEIDVLANDTDTSGTGISVTSLDNTGLLGQISTDGTTVTYDPNGQFDSLPLGGQDSEIFSYTITDGNGEIDSAVVTVTIDGVNDPPVAVDDDEQTQQGVRVSVDVLANDSDIDQGDVLSIDSFTTPGNGSVQEVEGELLYTPNADFFGTDTFTYTVTDSNGGFATATVTVEVEPPPFVPEFGSIDGETIEVEGSRKLVFAGGGNDLVDSSVSEGENRIYLQSGDDIAILGQSDRILGGVGDDQFFVTSDGDNTITGGEGRDQFWIATGDFTDGINTVTDFTIEEDVIGIAGFGIGFDGVELSQVGDDALIGIGGSDFALLLNTNINDLSASDFAFA
ncbi:Ig-like domain-containing protein [Crocosphaera watsonii WH 8501]|uniref:Tandem-95 repeat protein n=2 Tax=Crocosphaera watsonii TaxID=263511 RepID=Q4BUS6_CROWT|nr:Ig-like domain-containing protein [Crocosphaera watsonii]EAM47654.1 hypothetical protein CwatDRAFT_0310 [Crocosphaera watsonii WH 8501]